MPKSARGKGSIWLSRPFRNEWAPSKDTSEQQLRKSKKEKRSLVPPRGSGSGTRTSSISHLFLHSCLRSPSHVYFLLIPKTGSKSSSREREAHLLLSDAVRARLLRISACPPRNTFAEWEHTQASSARVSVCLGACARDDKSHSPSGISVLLAMSFHARQ